MVTRLVAAPEKRSPERTPFPEAIRKILDALSGSEENSTITSLSLSTGLNRRTVEKALEVILEAQRVLERKKLSIGKLNRIKMLRMEEKSGLLSLPDNLQKLIIRSAYFPTPSREEEIIVHLYLRGALSRGRAISLEKSELVKKLVKQGQLAEDQGKIYLTEEGVTVAKGALDLYPELKEVIKKPALTP
ncbi:MAG: hypothetical protein HXX80_02480 [Nitrososphaerales archaeon]|nr:hypothetical protein [Nitrososphaerales archaeon]